MSIFLDGVPVSDQCFIVRRGPGHTHYDFAQDIAFSIAEDEVKKQKYVAPVFHDIYNSQSSFVDSLIFQCTKWAWSL